jgi:KDO2-lipid IV(A) lauroyltransferase
MVARPEQVGRSFRHRFEGPGYRRIFLWGIRNIPQPLQRASMPLWASIFYALVPSARRAIMGNLEQVVGRDHLHRHAFRLFVQYAQSITNMYALHLGQQVPVETEFHGREHLLGVQARGLGAVVVTGHLGAWQLAPFLLEGKGLPPLTMAMAEEGNSRLAAFEERFRARFRIVYTTASPFSSLELAAVLRRGELVGMQLDRHLGGPHVVVPFCGRPAPFPLGPATLARASGCPIVPMFVVADAARRRCTFHVEEPIAVARTRDRAADVRSATERAVAVYERYVRRYPEQWFNFYDFWGAAGSLPR